MINLTGQRGNRAFTLAEILMTLFIMAVVVAMMNGVYISGLDVWETARVKADLQAEARMVLNRMIGELRNATRTSSQNPSPNLSIPSVPNNKHISFYLPQDKDGDGLITDSATGKIEWDTNNKIEYQYIPGQQSLRRLEKGEQAVLAQSVSDVQFIDINVDPSLFINELRIILTLNRATARHRDLSVTLSYVVALRN